VQKLLGREVDPQMPLTEAGLDSLGSVELRSSLGSTFELELPATLAFDYPTIAALTNFIASQLTTTQLVIGECLRRIENLPGVTRYERNSLHLWQS